jgi:NADH-quinone oxidoreductase subunit C
MTDISNHTLAAGLRLRFGEGILDTSEPYGILTVTVEKGSLPDIMRFLRDEPQFSFTFLTDLCGIHYPDNTGRELGVIYHLHSFSNNMRVRLKIFTGAADPTVSSVTSLFESANWMERETYDFYGILFKGHPNLKRILNMDELDYFPLQKQYPLEDGTRDDKNDMFFGR